MIFNNRGEMADKKILVRLHSRELIREVNHLITGEKRREAFDLIISEAEVIAYIPAGQKNSPKVHAGHFTLSL